MEFTKMHGLGNDFIIINCLEENLETANLSELACQLCDRHFGIGADGLILVLPSVVADFKMRFFNPDGSEAEMCGNGIRCFAKFLYARQLIKVKKVKVETLAGIIIPELIMKGGQVESVKVDMGIPRLKRKEIPMHGTPEDEMVINQPLKVADHQFRITCVSMGNPHCVIFTDNVDTFPIDHYGPLIETHRMFPNRTNVEFVEVVNPEEIKVRVWERGAGLTLSSGSGACGAAVAAMLNERIKREVKVHLLGGDLIIEWCDDNHVFLTGRAVEVFRGEIDLPK